MLVDFANGAAVKVLLETKSNGEPVSFRDDAKIAVASAIYMKTESKLYSRTKVQIRDRATGKLTTVLPDGRME